MRRQSIAAAAILAGLVLSACGALPAPLRSGAAQRAPMVSDMAVEEMMVEAEPALPAGVAPEEPALARGANLESVQERLVIRNANLSVVVEDPEEAVDRISAMAEEMGGFVVSSNVFQTTFGDSGLSEPIRARQASITVRVPSDQLDEALDRVKSDALDVQSQNVSGQDVTEEYTDLQSRLGNLEAAEEQLREVLASASRTEDVLRVLDELRRVREEIEVLRGRIQYLEQSARLSSLSVDLVPDVATQPLQIGRWTPQGTAKQAVEALIETLQFLGDVAIWTVICVLPIAAIVGIPAWIAVRAILRRRRRKRAQPQAEEDAASSN